MPDASSAGTGWSSARVGATINRVFRAIHLALGCLDRDRTNPARDRHAASQQKLYRPAPRHMQEIFVRRTKIINATEAP
jgi:hypothetical protein